MTPRNILIIAMLKIKFHMNKEITSYIELLALVVVEDISVKQKGVLYLE